MAGNNLNSDRRYSKNKSKRLEITEQQLLTTAGTSATALDRNHNNNNEDYEKEQLMPQLEKAATAAVMTTAKEDGGGSENPLTTRKWSPRGCEKCDSVRHRHPLHRSSDQLEELLFPFHDFNRCLLSSSKKTVLFYEYCSCYTCNQPTVGDFSFNFFRTPIGCYFFLSDIPALLVIVFSNFWHLDKPTLYCTTPHRAY